MSSLVRVLPLALVLSCATAKQPLIVSGQSLHLASLEFDATATEMAKLLDEGRITPEQYRPWLTFEREFKRDYPLAWDAWEEALRLSDAVKRQSAIDTITQLVADLARFYVAAMTTHQAASHADGGTP
jgi:hypothetical protein